MKIYMQQLHEEEEKMRKETFSLLRENPETDFVDTLKTIRILYVCNSVPPKEEQASAQLTMTKSFQRLFDTLKQLNKPITMLNNTNDGHNYLENASIPSVDLSVGDFVHNRTSLASTSLSSDLNARPSTSLCSNLDIKQRPASISSTSPTHASRPASHSTLIFEHSGIKIGFIALFDRAFCANKLCSKFIRKLIK